MFAGHKAELKTQGVVAAAQDPDSNVTSEDAKKVMEQEAKKAGIPAYRFDPNASPEDKAAAARAVSFLPAIIWMICMLTDWMPRRNRRDSTIARRRPWESSRIWYEN